MNAVISEGSSQQRRKDGQNVAVKVRVCQEGCAQRSREDTSLGKHATEIRDQRAATGTLTGINQWLV
jgi:hypothetical protein